MSLYPLDPDATGYLYSTHKYAETRYEPRPSPIRTGSHHSAHTPWTFSPAASTPRIALAGSLDPTTGIFYRTPEHPRLRTAQACEKCRTRKAKCSGEHPVCARCLARGLTCEYAKEGRVRGPSRRDPKSDSSSSPASSPQDLTVRSSLSANSGYPSSTERRHNDSAPKRDPVPLSSCVPLVLSSSFARGSMESRRPVVDRDIVPTSCSTRGRDPTRASKHEDRFQENPPIHLTGDRRYLQRTTHEGLVGGVADLQLHGSMRRSLDYSPESPTSSGLGLLDGRPGSGGSTSGSSFDGEVRSDASSPYALRYADPQNQSPQSHSYSAQYPPTTAYPLNPVQSSRPLLHLQSTPGCTAPYEYETPPLSAVSDSSAHYYSPSETLMSQGSRPHSAHSSDTSAPSYGLEGSSPVGVEAGPYVTGARASYYGDGGRDEDSAFSFHPGTPQSQNLADSLGNNSGASATWMMGRGGPSGLSLGSSSLSAMAGRHG